MTIYRNITILSDAKVEDMSISYEAKVFLTVYYVTLATIGIPGNILTCVFSVEKSSRKMSATNCFLLNLSIVDLLNLSLGETFSWSFFSSQLKLENMYRIEHSYHVKHENLLLVLIYVCSCFLSTYLSLLPLYRLFLLFYILFLF